MTLLRSDVMRYQELRVTIGGDRPPYTLNISSPNHGSESGEFKVPFSYGEVERALAAASSDGASQKQYVTRQVVRDAVDPMRDLGSRLYMALFQGTGESIYRTAWLGAEDEGMGLRICLAMSDPELTRQPWEFLYDVSRRDFLALTISTPLVRQQSSSGSRKIVEPVEPVEPPLRVLVLPPPEPCDLAAEELDRLRGLEKQRTGLLELTVLEEVPVLSTLDTLDGSQFHILHFLPERTYFSDPPPRSGLEMLLVMSPLETSVMQVVFKLKWEPRLVYHNSAATDWLVGRSPSPISAIGMTYQVSDQARRLFTDGLYRALLAGQPLEAAVAHGRRAIDLKLPGSREWGLPVFYMQAKDGVLLPPDSTTQERSLESMPLTSAPDEPENEQIEFLHLQLGVLEQKLVELLRRASYGSYVEPSVQARIKGIGDEIDAIKDAIEAEVKSHTPK